MRPDERPAGAGRSRLGDGDVDVDNEKPVTWRSLPRKSQLAILTVARLSEPLTQTSLQAYIFYMLRSFDPSLPDATIAAQAGLLQGGFTAAQFLTAVVWGRLADSAAVGRKRVLLVGLLGTCVSCVGFGFSSGFGPALVFRVLGGVLNSNVGVMRTMIAEIVVEKKYQSRAFLLLPMCFNVGVIVGPILGGILADPVRSYPSLLGPGSLLGGKDGVWWMRRWPYALPNVLSALFILVAAVAVFLGLDETHETARERADWGRQLGQSLARTLRHGRVPRDYAPLRTVSAATSVDLERSSAPTLGGPSRRRRPAFRQILTANVLLTLLAHFLLALHTSAFNAMTFVFLPTPRAPPGSRHGFFHFGGGLGLTTSRVGLATALIGVIGLPLQILLYPRVQLRLGTLRCYRTFLPFSPLAYLLMPFLVLVPRVQGLVWPAFAAVVGLQVVSRTFSLPATVILVNNAVSDPSVLGTVHGVAQSVASAARTLGPLVGGWGLGLGLRHNVVGAVWWALAVEAVVGWLITWTITEGRGIERRVVAESEEAESEEEREQEEEERR
ncbi:hypothetical protein VTN02DRAFT_4962 [Thermoascus thermophilus]